MNLIGRLIEAGGQRETAWNSQQKQRTRDSKDAQNTTAGDDEEERGATTQDDAKDLQIVTADSAISSAGAIFHSTTQDDKGAPSSEVTVMIP